MERCIAQSGMECLWEYGIVTPMLKASYRPKTMSLHRWLLYKFYGFDPGSHYELKVIMAEVERITYTEKFPFAVSGPDAVYGALHGPWDKRKKVFSDTPLFHSLRMRFVDGAAWEQTPKYQSAMRELDTKGKTWNSSRTKAEVNARCARLDEMYDDMKKHGYRIASGDLSSLPPETTKESCSIRGVALPDVVRIAVARDGSFIRCENGRHRLVIAKLLGIPCIPAIVQIEHQRWNGEPGTENSIAI